jgi:endoglucanase
MVNLTEMRSFRRRAILGVLVLGAVGCANSTSGEGGGGGSTSPATGGTAGAVSTGKGGSLGTGGSSAGTGAGAGTSGSGGIAGSGLGGSGGSGTGGETGGSGGRSSSGAGGTLGTGGLGGRSGTGGTGAAGSTGTGGGTTGGTKGTATGGTTVPPTGGAGGNATGGNTGKGGAGGTTVTVPGCNSPAPAGSPVALHGQLKVVGTRMQDQSGNAVQLKGISSYWLNWEGHPDAESKAALQSMRDTWKISILRGAMGTDVSGGYLEDGKAAMQTKIDTMMANALALGVYLIVDWHTGDAQNYQSQAITFFTGLATKYGSCPNIIYEDFNEPVNVTWAQIKPYHQAVVNAIRAIDPDNLIIMGTPTYSQDVDLAAASPVTGTNLLYTLHWYSCSHTQWLRDKGNTAISKGLALYVTEFGATNADGGTDGKVCQTEANNWFTWMATNGIGGTAWKLARGSDSSNLLSTNAPSGGPWTDSNLSQLPTGHGQIVVDWIRE